MVDHTGKLKYTYPFFVENLNSFMDQFNEKVRMNSLPLFNHNITNSQEWKLTLPGHS